MGRKREPKGQPAARDAEEAGAPSRRGGKKGKRFGPPGEAFDDEEGAGLGEEDDGDLDTLGVPLDSVVKVWCVHNTPNFSLPWQRRRQYRSSGSGFCIDRTRRLILTNAHCIEWHAQVKVQRRGSDTKHLAQVKAVGWECDCAILQVDDEEFWDGIQVVQLSKKVPHLEEPVLCVGFPVGGDTISVTSGVVSRVEVMTYAQTCSELLGIQIDAAINSGNSGGPAFNNNGECLGMAFQSIGAEQAENIGYVIPTVVIMHFLNDLQKHGRYTGFPTLGIETQTMENAHLRQAFGMDPKQKGLLVCRVNPTAAVQGHLQPNDVLLSFDGEAVANDGTIAFRKHERVAFSWLVAQKFYGEPAALVVLRDGERVELRIEDFHPEVPLVPVHLFGRKHEGPSYLILAGLVFTTLTVPFCRSEFGDEWDCEAPVEFVHRVMHERAEFKGQQLVVLTQVLAHDLTVGYEDLENVLLEKVNNEPVRNLRHLQEMADSCTSEYIRLSLYPNLMLVLKTEAAKKATGEALEQHTIPAAMSPDLAPEDAEAATGAPAPTPAAG
jgi:S1-C subfamily serine protease